MEKRRSFRAAHLLAGRPPTLGGVAKYLGGVGSKEIVLAVAVLSPVCGVGDASAQNRPSVTWTETTTLGYAGMGFGLAFAASWNTCDGCDIGALLGAWGAGLVGGGVVGYLVGRSAEAALKSGNWPSDPALWAIRAGTVAAFASLGAVTAPVVTSYTEGNKDDDVRILVILSAAGGLLGGVIQYFDERRLSRLVARGALPHVQVGPTGGLELGMRVTVH
jgi:membrane protein YqaA with SNARE-associated domain